MQEITVARNYAEALFELAAADGELQLYAEQLSLVTGVLESEPEFGLFLATPRLDTEVKKRALGEALEDQLPVKLLRFLFVVIDKRRTRVLPGIASEFSNLVNDHFGRVKVDVTIATEPDEALRAELGRRLASLLGREVIPRFRVDARIIGGVIVRVGDRIMDGSIRHRLHNLRRSLLRAEVG